MHVSGNNFPLEKAKGSEISQQDVFSPVPTEQAKLGESTRQADVASVHFGVQQELSSIDQHLSVEENVAAKSSDSPAESSTANAFLEGFPPATFDGIDLLFAMFLKELPALYVCPHHNYYDKHLACNDILFCVFIISFCKQM